MKKYILTFTFVILGFITMAAQSKTNVQITKLYQNYIAVKTALASDDAAKTTRTANEFLKTLSTIKAGEISEKQLASLKLNAKAISGTSSISTQRKSFEGLSNEMIVIANDNKLSDKTIFVQYCPMAKASWLSNEEKIVNPYYGSSMLGCGVVKSKIK